MKIVDGMQCHFETVNGESIQGLLDKKYWIISEKFFKDFKDELM